MSARSVLLTLLLLLGSACAKPTPVVPPAAQAVERTPGLFLYEVRGERGSVHLLGTIHMGFGFEEVLTPSARARFEGAARVMTEADVSAANPEQLIQAALLPPEQSLKQIIGEASWQKLVARVGAQIPEPLLERLEPWLPSVLLGLEDLEQALGDARSKGRQMDVELMAEAQRTGKPLSYLETVEEQVAIFDSIPLEEQVRELARSLESEDSTQARALLSAFQAGDEQALARALFDEAELAASPGFYERVLYQRNERWLPVIERELARGGSFVAVGAGHLLGERGLLAALKRQGYAVTRIGR
ncbi:MAG TPA: TraB/GumN family protein [Polyangiales bacterium]|nr:TraB/GumN family protein [Polyangiales bacterium]